MQTYDFDCILADVTEMTEDLAERVFAAGCDDSAPFSSNGVASVGFMREAESLESAIRSAIGQLQAAGFTVKYVTIQPNIVVPTLSGVAS